MYLVYKVIVIFFILYVSGSYGTSVNGKNVTINSSKPLVCGSHNCTTGQFCCGPFNSSCCNGLKNSTTGIPKTISSIIKTAYAFLNSTKAVVCSGFTCSPGLYCCGRYNSSCCIRANSTLPRNTTKTENAFLNSTKLVVCSGFNCSPGQYCCGRYNSSCCSRVANSALPRNTTKTGNSFWNSTKPLVCGSYTCVPGQYCCGRYNSSCCSGLANSTLPRNTASGGVFCNSTNARMSASTFCSKGQYCCGLFNTTCCSEKNDTNKGIVTCTSTRPSLSPSHNCTRGQFCCGDYNTTCCKVVVTADSHLTAFEFAVLIVVVFIIAIIKISCKSSGKDDMNLLINDDD